MIRGILLRPTDPSIFEPDVCGGRPPTALWTGRRWHPGPVTVEGSLGKPMAIVLAWDGGVHDIGVGACRVNDSTQLRLDLFGVIDEHEVNASHLSAVRRRLRHLGALITIEEQPTEGSQ